MRRLSVVSVMVFTLAVGFEAATAQPSPPARLVGRTTSQKLEVKPTTNRTVDTFTLRFGDEGSIAFTVDFVVQYASQGARTAPGIVDVVVTEHPAGEDQPELALTVDGRPIPLITRARQPRSIVTSISFDDFAKLAGAGSVVQRAFDTELVFGDAQLRLLKMTAERWAAQ